MTLRSLLAGAACVDITPTGSVFLFGYPHVPRSSTGVHDPLLCSALFLGDAHGSGLLISCDVIFVTRDLVIRARERIARQTGLAADSILIAATHTHSGPVTINMVSNGGDAVVPKADPRYLAQLEDAIVEAGGTAFRSARVAEAGLVIANGSAVGANRRDPDGPRDPEVPVLLVRRPGGAPIGAMLVCSMHPTVLHEDSTLISGDFPAFAREYIRQHVLQANVPVVYLTGPCGNQSPRHVTRGNTFSEARRLGEALGASVALAARGALYRADLSVAAACTTLRLPPRRMPTVESAQDNLVQVQQRLTDLRSAAADSRLIRTAECDWFGAEETLQLAIAAADGRLAAAAESVMPAEIQLLRLGRWRWVGWPGEVFVEYALEVKRRVRDVFLISMANGELQGYIVTPEAAAEGGYEASNALFDSASGPLLVDETVKLLCGAELAKREPGGSA